MADRRPVCVLAVAVVGACATAPAPDRSAGGAAAADDLFINGHVAAHYVHAPYDPADHATCKVWHDVHAADGRIVSKGPGGEFEHHRGLFIGWNQVQCGDRRFDFWHCNHGESQRHQRFVSPAELGLDGDWQVAAIAWCDAQGTAIVRERRALRARALDAATTALDVVVELTAADRAVVLGGDPQHSGHQFRALELFAPADAPKVRYLRPASAHAEPDDVWTGCSWIAAILPLPDGPVTVVRSEGRGNPPAVRWSTRDYGRFGATFTARLEPGAPLRLCYCYVVALGALDVDACERLAASTQP